MGRTVYWMNVSMDLFIGRTRDENGGGDWMRIDDALHRDFNARAGKLSLFVQGRTVFEIMEGFWPQAAKDASQPDVIQEYGRIWTQTPKVLVSNTRRDAKHDTRIVGGKDGMVELARLRRETAGEIGVGGANVATQMLRAGLLDELMLYVHPAILGSGRPLFDAPQPAVECDLIEHVAFDSGVVLQRYAVRGAQ